MKIRNLFGILKDCVLVVLTGGLWFVVIIRRNRR